MSSKPLVLAIDAGTTSTRVLAFDLQGQVQATSAQNIEQYFPQPGWVEHDAGQIWTATEQCLRDVLAAVDGDFVQAIGITNQRETVVLWDRATGWPLYRAIVWQDRRTSDQCAALIAQGYEPTVQQRTGLLLDPYFSATKIAWLLDHVPGARAAAEAGRLASGTIETWLVYKLTGGLHITDATNASRTSLMALTGGWDDDLTTMFDVPRALLPEIVDTCGVFGDTSRDVVGRVIPITGLIGDQQAAAVGQGCLAPGEAKVTFGTGAFLMAATGEVAIASRHRLLSTVGYQIGGRRNFALEGSVFVAGSAAQWLRDGLGMIASTSEIEGLAASVADLAGVVFVPALTGLGAPHWRPDARGLLTGLTRGTNKAHLARAVLEGVAHQTADVIDALTGDLGPLTSLKIDGGMSRNTLFTQILADVVGIGLERAGVQEATALGAAMMAAVGARLVEGLTQAQSMRQAGNTILPLASASDRNHQRCAWAHAIRQALVE